MAHLSGQLTPKAPKKPAKPRKASTTKKASKPRKASVAKPKKVSLEGVTITCDAAPCWPPTPAMVGRHLRGVFVRSH
jgi:hypothetical protein